MLDDRSYMRDQSQERRLSAVALIIIANIFFFILQLISQSNPPESGKEPFAEYFFLSKDGLASGYLWQLITFQFLHGGMLHLLLNCWCIYIFGRSVEEGFGKVAFFRIYFMSGVLGGMLHAILAFLFPAFNAPVVGASAGVCGLISVFACTYPDARLMIFPIPMFIKAKVMLYITIGIAVIGTVAAAFPQGGSGGIAHAAHLGGLLGGLAYVNFVIHGRSLNLGWPRIPAMRRPGRIAQFRPKEPKGKAFLEFASGEELSGDEFISKEVDPILDKISAHGIHSLTERERKILETARARMSKR